MVYGICKLWLLGIIYAAQLMQIPDEIKEEFVKGHFVVKGSKQNFCHIDPDQAQE